MRCIALYANDSREEFFMERKMDTRAMVTGAILTALVVVLQYVANYVKIGPFPITLVQIPIIIGVAVGGIGMGAWLGAVFGFVVLISGAGEPFFTLNPLATILICMAKGIACGAMAGVVYNLVSKWNRYGAVITAAVVSPIVNTGIFFLGCTAFFMDTVRTWTQAAGMGDNVAGYMFLGLAGINFLLELGSNILLSPLAVRLLQIRKNQQ